MSDIITCEYVGDGHPDKLADQISDGVLDACLERDANARVACETMVKAGKRDGKWNTEDDRSLLLIKDLEGRLELGRVSLSGEITTEADFDMDPLVRGIIREIGYDRESGMCPDNCAIFTHFTTQSPDISQGVTEGSGDDKEQGAGDQGMMYGYACSETPSFMPMAYVLAREVTDRLKSARLGERLSWLRPDSKSQITLERLAEDVWHIRNLTIANQHNPGIRLAEVRSGIYEEVIEEMIAGYEGAIILDHSSNIVINGTGIFVTGGPEGDCGLTGRKIIVDTYGGRERHGGGAFSGKDPSKVDRSAHYMSRFIARSIVESGLANECSVVLAYSIGRAEPASFVIDTNGTEAVDTDLLHQIVSREFDCRPKEIIERLGLRRPIYGITAREGHFGRDYDEATGAYSWEKAAKLKAFF